MNIKTSIIKNTKGQFELDEFLIDVIGINAHLNWRRSFFCGASHFQETGFCKLPNDLLTQKILIKGFEEKNSYKLDLDDLSEDSWSSNVSKDIIDKLNERHLFFPPPPRETKKHLQRFLDKNKDLIESEIGSCFSVSNIRFDSLLPGQSYGPSKWHRDGGPSFLRKILIYPNPMKKTVTGAFEFFDRTGNKHLLESEGPSALLYDTSILLHRGYPPKFVPRPMIEITLYPSSETNTKLHFSGHLARTPKISGVRIKDAEIQKFVKEFASIKSISPKTVIIRDTKFQYVKKIYRRLLKLTSMSEFFYLLISKSGFNKYLKLKDIEMYSNGPIPSIDGQISNNRGYLIIKSGSRLSVPGWLDVKGSVFSLNPDCNGKAGNLTIPLLSSSCHTSVIDHTLGQFDDAKVNWILDEINRVLRDDGKLILLLPKYKEIVENWKTNNEKMLSTFWHQSFNNSLPSQIEKKGNIPYSSFICSFKLNDELTFIDDKLIKEKLLNKLASIDSPKLFANSAKEFLMSACKPEYFVFQNAWSLEEMFGLLVDHGFSPSIINKETFRKEYYWLPPGICIGENIDIIIADKKNSHT